MARASGGVLDLRGRDLNAHALGLDGEWKLAWGEFLAPRQAAAAPFARLHRVPLPWKEGGLPSQGHATYFLRVFVDPQPAGRLLGLRIPDLNTAYRLYVNETEVASAGVPGPDAASTRAAFRPQVAYFPVATELRFVVHVANFEHRKGGLDETLRLGSAEVIRSRHERNLALTLFVFGCILVAGLYDFLRFALRPTDLRSLYFAFFCLFLALRTLVTGQYYLTELLPGLSLQVLLKLEYLTLYGAVPFLAAFFRAQFPSEFSARMRTLWVVVCAGFAAVVVGWPVMVFNQTLSIFFALTFVFMVYSVARLVVAVSRGRAGAVPVLVGGGIFAIAVVLDILHNQYILRTTASVATFGFLIFTFSQSYILAQSSARNAAMSEQLSMDLETRVVERTFELEDSRNRLSRTLTELQEARDRAEESSRLKSEFVAVMSHEIRTPLNSIIGIGALLADLPQSEEQKDLIRVLRQASENLGRLIDDILDFSRIEAGRLTLEERAFEMGAVVDRAIGLVRIQAQEKGLRLETDLARAPRGRLLGDPSRLEQILMNLLGNAVKFTEHGLVHLRVSTLREDSARAYVRFRVADTGIGIPAEFQGRIFESFTQADASMTRRYGGTGLGLAITKRLCGLMGGSIAVESLPGEGSVFTVELPFGIPAGAQADNGNGSEAVRAGAVVLLAEDNADNRLLVRQFLRGQPIELHEVTTGSEAVGAVKERAFDVVLMDVRMPIMDGYEAVKRIRAWEEEQRRSRVPILALTANASREDVERSMAAGCDEHLSKPIDRRRLLEALGRHTLLTAGRPSGT